MCCLLVENLLKGCLVKHHYGVRGSKQLLQSFTLLPKILGWYKQQGTKFGVI